MSSVFFIVCIGSRFWLICVLVANIHVVRCIGNTIITYKESKSDQILEMIKKTDRKIRSE